jgi:hypothetical protein
MQIYSEDLRQKIIDNVERGRWLLEANLEVRPAATFAEWCEFPERDVGRA